jgi:hypothetical protein
MTVQNFIENIQKLTSLEKHKIASALFDAYSFRDNVQICCCVSCGKLGGCVKGYLQGVGTETWYNSHFTTGLNGNQVCDACVEKKMQEEVKNEIEKEMEKQEEEEYESEEEWETEYEDSREEREYEKDHEKECDNGDEKTECICCGEEIEEEGCSCETSQESENCLDCSEYASECEDCGECVCCCCECGKEKRETEKEIKKEIKKETESPKIDKLKITVEKEKNQVNEIISKKLLKKAHEIVGYKPHKELSDSAKIWTILRNAGKLSGYISIFNGSLKTLENCKKCEKSEKKKISPMCDKHTMNARLEVIYCEIEGFIGELQSTINSRENINKEIKGINDCIKSLAQQVKNVFEDFRDVV